MADGPVTVKDQGEKIMVLRGLTALRQSLLRFRHKEVAGSEIWVLRGKEIDSVSTLIARFS